MGILITPDLEWLRDEKFLSALLLLASIKDLNGLTISSKLMLYIMLEAYNYVYTEDYNWIKVNHYQLELPLL